MAEVTNIEEHDDGTATLHFDLTDEEVRMLIQWGIKEAIKLALHKANNFDWKDSGSETNT
jgi:hypothetical protein